MSKSEGQKMKLFALKEILEQETDANHGISMSRILELLKLRGTAKHEMQKMLHFVVDICHFPGYNDFISPQLILPLHSTTLLLCDQ